MNLKSVALLLSTRNMINISIENFKKRSSYIDNILKEVKRLEIIPGRYEHLTQNMINFTINKAILFTKDWR